MRKITKQIIILGILISSIIPMFPLNNILMKASGESNLNYSYNSTWDNGTKTWNLVKEDEEYRMVWGWNGTDYAPMVVKETFYRSGKVDTDYYINNVSIFLSARDTSQQDTFKGGEASFNISYYILVNSVNLTIGMNYTWYNILQNKSSGDWYVDFDSNINETQVHADNRWFGSRDDYFDTYPMQNVSVSNLTYTSVDWGHSVNQSAASIIATQQNVNLSYVNLYTQRVSFTVYNDTNHNGYMDYGLIPNPLNKSAWIHSNSTDFEPRKTMHLFTFSKEDIGINARPKIELGPNFILFSYVITNILALFTPYGYDLAQVLWNQQELWIGYIPYMYTSFYFGWDDNAANLAEKTTIGPCYNFTRIKDEGKLEVMEELKGYSLAIDYVGTFVSATANIEFSDFVNGTNALADSDGLLTWSLGEVKMMQINGTGTYILKNQTGNNEVEKHNITSVVYPLATVNLEYQNYVKEAQATAHATIVVFVFATCIESWDGYEFSMDPTFTTFILGNPSGDNGAGAIILILGVIIVIAVVIRKKKRSSAKVSDVASE